MPNLPRNPSPQALPDGNPEPGELLRRYEITIEREFLSIKRSTARCPDCGREILSSAPEPTTPTTQKPPPG